MLLLLFVVEEQGAIGPVPQTVADPGDVVTMAEMKRAIDGKHCSSIRVFIIPMISCLFHPFIGNVN